MNIRRSDAAVLALLVVLMALLRLHTATEPLDMDNATYAAIAQEMRLGGTLYVDVWDHKPPAIYLAYAAGQELFGYGGAHTYVLWLFLATVILLGIYRAASTISRGAGLAASAFWALIATTPTVEANQPNVEIFLNAAQVGAFALLVRSVDHEMSRTNAALVGLLFGLASIFKPIAVVFAALMAIAYAVGALRRSRWPVVAADIALMIGAAVAVWAALAVGLAVYGILDPAYDAIILFNRDYAGPLIGNLRAALSPGNLLPLVLLPILPLIVLAVAAVGFADWRRPGRLALFGGAYAIATFVEIALPGRFFPHYYQLSLPVVSIGAAWSLSAIGVRYGARVMRRIGFAAAGYCVLFQVVFFGWSPAETSRMKFGPRLVDGQRAVAYLERLLETDERFVQWGHSAELYYYARQRPPIPEFRYCHVFAGERTDKRIATVIERLERAPPEVILETWPWPLHDRTDGVTEWIRGRYIPFLPGLRLDGEPIHFLYRKNGGVETRLKLTPAELARAEREVTASRAQFATACPAPRID